ncbi:hypothetical protein CDAR_603731 [Caerostris darwini]|uniref:Uncharacterized protein n=1 Tax=Caerostris darwini TaxID=1538125 RepID=A0AAV4T3A9_9ARAC|nr:hypothetical protein CDAR_603731 [Caerostris darwini]
MKYLVFAALFVLFVVEVTAPRPPPPSRPPRPPKPGRCSSSEDCKENECCVDRSPSHFRKGRCERLGREGRRCTSEEADEGRYSHDCPCAQGLDCVARKIVKTPWGDEIKKGERCVDPSRTTVEPDTGSEAPETEEPEKEPEEEPETPAEE